MHGGHYSILAGTESIDEVLLHYELHVHDCGSEVDVQ